MSNAGRPPDSRTPHPTPLWPYGMAAAVLIFVTGALHLEHTAWTWALRLVDAILVAAYALAIRCRGLAAATGNRGASPPRDTGLVVAGIMVVAAVVGGILVATSVIRSTDSSAIGLAIRAFVLVSAIRRATQGGSAQTYEVQLRSLRPVHVTLASFALAIGTGWALLNLPQAAPRGQEAISPLDALFTATSSTCVTGLIVKDTPNDFSLLGHLVILALIQVGGLGIMTFAAIFDVLRRRSLSVRRRLVVGDMAARGERVGLRGVVLGTVLFTLSTEAAGAILLWARWRGTTGSLAGDLHLGLFHSISAFCNAGFSLFSNSLEDCVGDPVVNFAVGALIILGGLGFPVVRALWRAAELRRRGVRRPLDLHTKLVLVTTGWLLAIGFGGFVLLERNHTLAALSPSERLLAGVFQSLTPRTAGFNTVPIGRIAPATLLFVTILMAIGASPGSTGGGIKTSTAAVLGLILRAMVSGTDRVAAFGRAIPPEVRHRAVAVGGLFAAGIATATILLCATDQLPLGDALFEVTSAFGTVGLSTGVTSRLTALGKTIVILSMYAGRVGPLSLAMAVQTDTAPRAVRFPEEHVMVG
jgi:trk system potassium uptake protein TrkH